MFTDLLKPSGLGITFDGGVGTIRVYSETAESIRMHIVANDEPRTVLHRLELIQSEPGIWSATDALIVPGVAYTLRANGPESPKNKFNPNIDLIDPYARGVVRDSAREYHCVAVTDDFDWQGVNKPNVPLDEAVIYEAHARGLTRGNDNIPDDIRGTYAALAHPDTIGHLKKLGVTSVELLPIQMFISEPHLMKMGLISYWGYNTINFFAPHPRYASEAARAAGPQAVINELKTAIRELHRNGIEVIMDVVYNHTAEGGGGGLTYSYRGLDNANYYRIDENGWYHDTTGCGNSLNFGNPAVLQLVMDSLRYWTNEMQIDGFRFDLASTLARNADNQYDPNHPLLRAIVEDPTFADTKMIVEPWDVGLGGWQTGNFPDRFSEWNDRYRDSIRRFWLSDIASARQSGNHWNGVADLATRLAGSRDIVDGPSGTLGTVNFITAHDGFTLHDLVSYNVKHNQVNGEGNRDGTNNNYSFNHGAEGEHGDPVIASQRRKSMRNLMGTLLFSSGIPMITAGDERGKTQQGNNNAYCQDNVLSWVNWNTTRQQDDLEATVAYLIKLRRENPVLRPKNFGDFDNATAETDMIKWYNRKGEIMSEGDWHNPERRTLLRYSSHLNEDGSHNSMLLLIHGRESMSEITLPEAPNARKYELLWNSAHELPPTEVVEFSPGELIEVSGTSIWLLRAVE
jgi:glycogen operon protein